MSTKADRHAGRSGTRAVRLAVGFGALAVERLRGTTAVGTPAALAVDVAWQASQRASDAVTAATRRSRRFADRVEGRLARVPGGRALRVPVDRAAGRWRAATARAARRGQAVVDQSRAEARSFLDRAMDDSVTRAIDGALPEIRAKVVPVIVADLTADPAVRELVVEQSRGAVTEATEQLRDSTAVADDLVESTVRRLLRGRRPPATK